MQRNSQGHRDREIEKVLGKATPGLSRSRVPARRSVLKLLEPDGEGKIFFGGEDNKSQPLEMKKDKKKKKKPVKGKKGELYGTGESLTDSLCSEEGVAGGGDGRGEEKTGTKTIEEKCGSQEIKAQNDEGRCESKGTEDIVTESKKPGGQGMVKKVANKEENTKNTGVFRGCPHITSANFRGFQTPPPPLVSNGRHLTYPLPPLWRLT